MSLAFLSKTKIDDGFIAEIVERLESDGKARNLSEDKEIILNIVHDLKSKADDKRPGYPNFILTENEYNYLSQNEKATWADYLIFRYKFKIYPYLKRITDYPIHILVEIVSYCNLRCRKCFQTDATFTKFPYMGHMDIGLFKGIIDEASSAGARALTMASRGEPTLHPEFGKILECAKGKFFDIKLNTNAMLLDEEKSRQILEGDVTELVFSVDFTNKRDYNRVCVNGDFDRVVSNIKRFHTIRSKEYPRSRCRTRVSGVKYDRSFDDKDFVKFWEEIVDNVASVDIVNHLWDAYNNKPLNKRIPCPLLWQRVYIWYDGTVNPCDYDYKSLLKMGSVKGSSIRDIWRSKQFEALRKDHMEGAHCRHIPCDRCERYDC